MDLSDALRYDPFAADRCEVLEAEMGVMENDGDQLSTAERERLDEDGFVALGQLLSVEELSEVRARIDSLLVQEGDRAGDELLTSPHIRHPKEAGADRLADLVNKGPDFDRFYTHPRVLAAVGHVLKQDFKLSSLNYRSAKPGTGEQRLHVDWHAAIEPGDYQVCNSIWLLDDFTVQNGATRLVPGTHRDGRLPESEMSDPTQSHPEEVLLEAPAGTVVVFNSHVWHGGTTNRSALSRRAIHSYFCRSHQPQQLDQRRFLTTETSSRLSDSELKLVLG